MATTRAEHEALTAAAKVEQDRIKQEIEKLTAVQEDEKNALKEQYEKLVEETKENEKVIYTESREISFQVSDPFISLYRSVLKPSMN